MSQKLWAAGALPHTHWRAYSAPLAGEEWDFCWSLPASPWSPLPALCLAGLGFRPLGPKRPPLFFCQTEHCNQILTLYRLQGIYSATSNNTKLVHWPLMGGLLHFVQRWGAWRATPPPSPFFAVPNVTAYPSTASVHNHCIAWCSVALWFLWF